MTDETAIGAYPDGDTRSRRTSSDVVGPFSPSGFARRDSLRVPVGRPADVLALAPGTTLRRWMPCELRDISASGAAIVLHDLDVEPGHTVLVRLHSGDVLLLQVAGEVVRSAGSGDTMLYGIRFAALPEARRAQIIDLVLSLYGARPREPRA
jgi:c-di-GMP-binding flagellar brake protein YcgR